MTKNTTENQLKKYNSDPMELVITSKENISQLIKNKGDSHRNILCEKSEKETIGLLNGFNKCENSHVPDQFRCVILTRVLNSLSLSSGILS